VAKDALDKDKHSFSTAALHQAGPSWESRLASFFLLGLACFPVLFSSRSRVEEPWVTFLRHDCAVILASYFGLGG